MEKEKKELETFPQNPLIGVANFLSAKWAKDQEAISSLEILKITEIYDHFE